MDIDLKAIILLANELSVAHREIKKVFSYDDVHTVNQGNGETPQHGGRST